MAITLKNLYFAQLPDSRADLFSAANIQVVHNIWLHNTNATAETVEISVEKSSTDLLLYNYEMAADETLQIDAAGEGLVLESSTSMKIRGNTTTASKVTCIISGSEIS